MEATVALSMLSEITTRQWGMVTSAQAGLRGVTRLTLSRLTATGHLERLAHGIYQEAGAPRDQLDDLRAAWLSTEPKTTCERRLRNPADGVVIAGTSATRLHDLGDLWAGRYEFVTPHRRQSQRTEIRYRQRTLDPRDVTLQGGLPVMTVERTIADLVEGVGDLHVAAGALRRAANRVSLDQERLRTLLAPLAERNGLGKKNGDALLTRLFDMSGVGTDAVAQDAATASRRASGGEPDGSRRLRKAATSSHNEPDRRDIIIDAALKVITDVGVHRTTHRRVAAAAGVPLGSLTYYFTSLEDLLGQAFVHLVDIKSAQFRRAMESADTPQDAASAVVDLVCGSAYASAHDMNLIFEMYAYAHHNPVVCVAAGEWVRQSRASLGLHYSGEVCASLNVMIEGWPMHRAFLGADLDRRIVAATVDALVRDLPRRVEIA